MDTFTSELINLLNKVLIVHFSVGVCFQDFDQISFVLHHEVKISFFIKEHGNTNRLATNANISLDFFIVTFFVREEDWILFCGCNTIKNDAIIVLAAQCYIKTTMRLDLNNSSSMHDIITNTTIHASFIASHIVWILHRERIGINFNNVEKNISLFALILFTLTFCTCQKSNSLSVLFKAASLFMCRSFVFESNLLKFIVVTELQKVMTFIKFQSSMNTRLSKWLDMQKLCTQIGDN